MLGRMSLDDQLIALWLRERPEGTERSYRDAIECFRSSVGKPLILVNGSDLYDLISRGIMTVSMLYAVKSLVTFGAALGYLGDELRATMISARELLEVTIYRQVYDQLRLAGKGSGSGQRW